MGSANVTHGKGSVAEIIGGFVTMQIEGPPDDERAPRTLDVHLQRAMESRRQRHGDGGARRGRGDDVMTDRRLGTRVFPAMPESVRDGRHWLAATLAPELCPEDTACDSSVLLLSEGLTNSIVHGSGDKVEVSAFIHEASVRVEITDGGGSTLPHYVDDPCGEGGRGLPIMRAVAREWGFEVLDDGRLQLWFEVPCDGAASE
jgi:anti-sigma regulatory factor (Ser/Thr protein kinase)